MILPLRICLFSIKHISNILHKKYLTSLITLTLVVRHFDSMYTTYVAGTIPTVLGQQSRSTRLEFWQSSLEELPIECALCVGVEIGSSCLQQFGYLSFQTDPSLHEKRNRSAVTYCRFQFKWKKEWASSYTQAPTLLENAVYNERQFQA